MERASASDATAAALPGAAEVFAILERAPEEPERANPTARSAYRARERSRARGRPLVGVVSLAPGPFSQPLIAAVCWRLLGARCEPFRCDLGREGAAPLLNLRRGDVSGLVVLGAGGRDESLLEPLLASGTPIVLLDFDLIGDRVARVMSNNLEGMASVVRHLFRLGRRRVATLAGPPSTRPGADRLLGYRSAIAALGLQQREDYVVDDVFTPSEGLAACRALLARKDPPDAVACTSDTLAVGAIVAVEEAGLSVPADIAVTGFDDLGFARRMRPALTTVRLDVQGLAVAAADALRSMLQDPSAAPSARLLATELVVRESSGRG